MAPVRVQNWDFSGVANRYKEKALKDEKKRTPSTGGQGGAPGKVVCQKNVKVGDNYE